MVVRVWIIAGAAFIVVAWLLTVPISPRPFQGSATSHLEAYRAEGLMPKSALKMSRSIGHEVFEVPSEDAEQAQMTGMSMPSGGDHAGMPGMTSPQPDHGGHGDMPGMQTPTESEPAHGPMPGMTAPQENQERHGAMPEMQMPMEPDQAHGQIPGMAGPVPGHEEHGAGAGLVVLTAHGPHAAHAREVHVQMREWGFAPARVEVKPGEVVRLVVRNAGNNPHEFMLMSHAAMAAVNYRLQRADWNLLEHEALYEREIVMPGDAIEVTLRVEQPGAWMFMCMFPYHMQFGMMGTLATEGQGMDMGPMHM